MDNNDIVLEGNTATWQMPLTEGEIHGTYSGTFQFRCFLDPIRQLQAGREYRDLLGPNAMMATDNEGNLAFALVQLKHRITKAPPFWTSTLQESNMAGNIGDLNVITLVLDASIRAETLYKEKVQKERDLILERSIKLAEEKIQKEKGV